LILLDSNMGETLPNNASSVAYVLSSPSYASPVMSPCEKKDRGSTYGGGREDSPAFFGDLDGDSLTSFEEGEEGGTGDGEHLPGLESPA
jgi:hypothetical protein